MKTPITILILLVVIAIQLILWAISDLLWKQRINEMQWKWENKARELEGKINELQELQMEK